MARVLCTVCDHEMRKSEYDVKRHWDNKHQDRLERGEKPSWKFLAKGCSSLEKFVVEKKKSDQGYGENEEDKVERSDEESTAEEIAQIEDSKSTKRSLSNSEFVDEKENSENPHKKIKSDDIGMVMKKLAEMDKKINNLQGTQNEVQQKENKEDKNDLDRILRVSKTVEELEVVLESIDFKKEEDVNDDIDGFYCELCFGGSRPNWEGKGECGAFKFEKEKDKEETSGNQSRQLRHLKERIKQHINRKTHKQKKEIKQAKLRIDKKRKVRSQIGGRNVFRNRYQGIKQSKSRLDFEEDMLRAKLNGEDVGDLNHSREFAKKLDGAIYDEMKARMAKNMELNWKLQAKRIQLDY